MTSVAATTFDQRLTGWGLGLGFILMMLVISLLAAGLTNDVIETLNPLRPLIRWVDSWQQHRFRMRELEARYRLRAGNPDWERFLEGEETKDAR